MAVSFCGNDERSKLQAIQRGTKQTLSIEAHPAGIPTVAAASAGASLMPSPTIPTERPSTISCRMRASFCSGSRLASTCSMPAAPVSVQS